MSAFIQEHFWGVISAIVFTTAWSIQVYYMLNYFLRASQNKPYEGRTTLQPVSVVICARNEEKNLMDHIPTIMDQDYPDFEVIVVNDSSWDDTEAILKALSLQFPTLRVVHIDEEKQNMQGKKFALTLGIKAAKNDIILLTDADCVPASNNWIREMTERMNEKTQLVLGYSPYRRYPGWLNRIVRFDTMMIGCHYLGLARVGKPYMGVGRNMAYNKELFFKIGGFKSHYSITSGDDDLFVNQVATAQNTITISSPASQTNSEPKKTWNEWFTQKRRHFTTAPYYKREHKFRLALWPLSFFLLLSAFVSVLVFQTWVLVVSALLLLRYILQMAILHRVSKKLNEGRDLAWLAMPLEIHLHLLNLGLYFTNLMRKPQKWN